MLFVTKIKDKWKNKAIARRKEINKLKKENKINKKSRDVWKSKALNYKTKLEAEKKKIPNFLKTTRLSLKDINL